MHRLKHVVQLGLMRNTTISVHANNTNILFKINRILIRDKFVFSESKRHISDALQHDMKTHTVREVVQNLGLDLEMFNKSTSVSPELLRASACQWEACFYELVHNGFTNEECLRMVTVYPPLLKCESERISEAILAWRHSQLGDARILALLRNCPHFICIDLKEIRGRIPLLVSLSSKKHVTNILKNVPNLMLDNWSEVVAKVDYLENVMKIDKKKILKTYALNRTLLALKTRHVFLERCGMYTYPSPKADPNEPSKNPALSSITDTDDEHFATKVAGLNVEEFEVFQDMYAEEIEEEDSDFSDSDSD